MINSKHLTEFCPKTKIPGGKDITLETLRGFFKTEAADTSLPLSVSGEEVKFGGLFDNSVSKALRLSHPQHSTDYYNYIVVIDHYANSAFISVYTTGTSKLGAKLALRESAKTSAANVGKRAWHGILNGGDGEFVAAGKAMADTARLLSSGVRALRSMGVKKADLEAEQYWYSCIEDLIDDQILC